MRRAATGLVLRRFVRWVLAVFYSVAGVLHIVAPAPFLAITPAWVPWPFWVVVATGAAEIAGAIGLVQPFSARLRRWAGIGLALYALAVWPANINHFAIDMARADGGLGLAYHVPRMIAQPFIIWLAIWVSHSDTAQAAR